MIVVGLSGYAGAGKDAVADILVSEYGFTKRAFADPLKRMLRRLDPIIGHDLYAGCCAECADIPEVTEVRFSDAAQYGFDDESLKRSPWDEEVRRLWQRFGTEVFREENENYWVHKAADDLLNCHLERVVFTDVRFENEAEFIFDLGENPVFDQSEDGPRASSLWRIARPDHYPEDVHESEQMVGLLGEEVTILNNGSLEDLEEPVALAMDLLLSSKLPAQLTFEIEGWE